MVSKIVLETIGLLALERFSLTGASVRTAQGPVQQLLLLRLAQQLVLTIGMPRPKPRSYGTDSQVPLRLKVPSF